MRLTKRIKREIESFAQGSIYRMNAPTADCYAFYLCQDSQGKLDFGGGYDWSNRLVDQQAEYIYMLDSKEFIKIK